MIRIGVKTAEATTVTIPSGHIIGDLLIIFAFRDGSVTNPTVPAGWTTLTNSLDGTLCSVSVGYKIAASNAETSGTWTSASVLACHVYRGQLQSGAAPVGTGVGTAGTTSTLTYGAVTVGQKGSSWILAFLGHNSNDGDSPMPSGLVHCGGLPGVNTSIFSYDTGGPTSISWPSTTFAYGGTASGYITYVIEVFAQGKALENFKTPRAGSDISVG